MGMTELQSLKSYVKKKGIGFFLTAPDDEREALEGILFSDGYPRLSLLYLLFEN